MPRSRLVWHLFVAWCLLAGIAVGVSFWLASVHLGLLADEAELQRLEEAATAVAAATVDRALPALAPAGFAAAAQDHGATSGIVFELIDASGEVQAVAPGADRSGSRTAGRGESRFDAVSGTRYLAVDAAVGQAATPLGHVRAMSDTRAADRRLAGRLRGLLVGHLLCAGLAAAAGAVVARRVAGPVEELSRAAVRLADGDVDVAVPVTELADLAELARAVGVLREQVVEGSLRIGRQGTQQEAVLGSMIEGVLAIDARQRIIGINRAASELLGIDLDSAVSRSLPEVVRHPDLRRFALTAIDCRAPVEDDLVLRGNGERTIRMRGTALRDMTGEGGAVIVLNDITDTQRLETIRRDFVANVSHELKTPITSIQGFVETLLDGAADDAADRRRFLEIVARQAERLSAIIDDLLALSRIEQSEGAGDLPLESTSVGRVLGAAVADCGPRAREKAIRLELACDDGLMADVNSPLLEQAVINLIDNAIQYSDAGSAIWIEAAEGHEDTVSLRVRDEGCGIAAEHLPRLFERFYRADRARSRRLGGTGLGLAIVKHIAQAHGGSVSVESVLGRGSTFTIQLPGRGPTSSPALTP
jgi:two-component system phosphate regulon sensor histidine kinase PhoR